MKKIKTIIVDDEPLALDLLRSYLDEMPEIEILTQCKNGAEAIKAAMELSPDLIFLDIQMPGMNGFDVVKRIQADIMPLVVFVTAFDEYALDAFDIHAVDYILKPLDVDRITRAVMRSIELLGSGEEEHDSKHRIIGAIDEIAQKVSDRIGAVKIDSPQAVSAPEEERKIAVKDRDAITLIDQSDIEWVDAAGDYMCIHVGGETHIMRSTLKNLLDQLNPAIFKRVHRSTIVNLNRIKQIIPHTKGEYFLLIGDHERLKVSRNFREVIKGFLSDS